MRTKGWQSILKFTLIQHIKTKSFIIGTVIVCVIVAAVCVLSNVLPMVLGADDAIDDMIPDIGGGTGSDNPDEAPLSFSNIYLKDEAGILTNEDTAALEKAGAVFTKTDQSNEELMNILEGIAESEDPSLWEAALLIKSQTDDGGAVMGYDVTVLHSKGCEDDAELLSEMTKELISRRNMLNLGVSEENYPQTQISVYSTVIEAGAEQWDVFTSAINYFVPMVVSLVLFLLIFSYGTTVAQSIATEKTSRVMELLLTSVRPLAVVIGKVLAMGIVSFGQFILIGTVGALSLAISAPFGFIGKLQGIMASPEFAQMTQQATTEISSMSLEMSIEDIQMAQAVNDFMASFTPFNIILIVVIFLLGFMFFSLIAAMVGASISRIEDLSAAMQPYSLMGVLGMYLAYFPVIFNVGSIETGVATTNPVQIFSYYFPLSSPFALPSAILLGTLSKAQCVLATVVLAAAVVLVAILVSKIYEAIILHNGNRIKFSDMIKMAARK